MICLLYLFETSLIGLKDRVNAFESSSIRSMRRKSQNYHPAMILNVKIGHLINYE